jgi:hypothetical protein
VACVRCCVVKLDIVVSFLFSQNATTPRWCSKCSTMMSSSCTHTHSSHHHYARRNPSDTRFANQLHPRPPRLRTDSRSVSQSTHPNQWRDVGRPLESTYKHVKQHHTRERVSVESFNKENKDFQRDKRKRKRERESVCVCQKDTIVGFNDQRKATETRTKRNTYASTSWKRASFAGKISERSRTT